MILVNRIAFGSLSKQIGRIRHSTATVTLLLTTITEVLTDAHLAALWPLWPQRNCHEMMCLMSLMLVGKSSTTLGGSVAATKVS